MDKIVIGREFEVVILNRLFDSPESSFIAITGRRRVGKTYLINTHFKKEMTFHFSGLLNATMEQQLQSFSFQLEKHFKRVDANKIPVNWMEAFMQLEGQLRKMKKSRKKVIFIDELPWLDTHKSGFIPALEWFWNNSCVHQNVLLVVCGSATSWMIRKIVNNKGGLHNRLTGRIHLKPFTLKETAEFLHYRKIRLSPYQITQLYMALGGIPHYLNDVRPGESTMQVIDRMCFQKDGLLVNEFENLYQALFKNAEMHLKVVLALSSKNRGMTRQELLSSVKLLDGGAFTNVLEELEWCNFIHVTHGYGKIKKDNLYRLTDEFSLFYLQFMYKKHNVNWLQLASTNKWASWAGYAFENCCLKHLDELKKILGISGVYVEVASFYSSGSKDEEVAQIDLVIDRKDGIIHLCEMKFYEGDFQVNKEFAKEIERKTRVFREKTKTRKTIFPTLITSFGMRYNEYSVGLIQQSIVLEQLFS
jgi:AAA+ ATPase superfamily predicted ATPase